MKENQFFQKGFHKLFSASITNERLKSQKTTSQVIACRRGCSEYRDKFYVSSISRWVTKLMLGGGHIFQVITQLVKQEWGSFYIRQHQLITFEFDPLNMEYFQNCEAGYHWYHFSDFYTLLKTIYCCDVRKIINKTAKTLKTSKKDVF